MEKTTKLLLFGASLSLLICLSGYLTSIRDRSQLADLVKTCEAEHLNVPKTATPKFALAPLVCDPDELFVSNVTSPSVGIQKEIVESHSNAGRTFNQSIYIAGIVFVILSIPYAWYFLLRRIRELRNAIAGK